jgi:hypothetical protein
LRDVNTVDAGLGSCCIASSSSVDNTTKEFIDLWEMTGDTGVGWVQNAQLLALGLNCLVLWNGGREEINQRRMMVLLLLVDGSSRHRIAILGTDESLQSSQSNFDVMIVFAANTQYGTSAYKDRRHMAILRLLFRPRPSRYQTLDPSPLARSTPLLGQRVVTSSLLPPTHITCVLNLDQSHLHITSKDCCTGLSPEDAGICDRLIVDVGGTESLATSVEMMFGPSLGRDRRQSEFQALYPLLPRERFGL